MPESSDRRHADQPLTELPQPLAGTQPPRGLAAPQLEQIIAAYTTALDCRLAADRVATVARTSAERAQLVQDVGTQAALVAEFARAVSTSLVMASSGRRQGDRSIYEGQAVRNMGALNEAARMCLDTARVVGGGLA